MPWTFAHPAIVLPIVALPAMRSLQRPVFLLAAMLGAMSPDFAYYLGPIGDRLAAHSLLGSVLLCIPMVWLLILLLLGSYRFLLRPLAPMHRQLWEHWLSDARQQCTLRNALMISICIWFGALSHIAWDHFTHRTGWAMHQWPAPFGYYIAGKLPVYALLQHLSTIIGSLALLVSYRRALVRSSITQGNSQLSASSRLVANQYLLFAIGAAALVGLLVGIDSGLAIPRHFWRVFYFEGAVAATQCFAMVWLALCVYLARPARKSRY